MGHDANQRREVTEDTDDLPVFFQNQFAPVVAKLHRGHRLDEQRCASVGSVVNDAGDTVTHLRLDRHDQSVSAHRDDWVLKGVASCRGLDKVVQRFGHGLVSMAHLISQYAQCRRRVVHHIASSPDLRAHLALKLLQVRDHLGDVRHQRGLIFCP